MLFFSFRKSTCSIYPSSLWSWKSAKNIWSKEYQNHCPSWPSRRYIILSSFPIVFCSIFLPPELKTCEDDDIIFTLHFWPKCIGFVDGWDVGIVLGTQDQHWISTGAPCWLTVSGHHFLCVWCGVVWCGGSNQCYSAACLSAHWVVLWSWWLLMWLDVWEQLK